MLWTAETFFNGYNERNACAIRYHASTPNAATVSTTDHPNHLWKRNRPFTAIEESDFNNIA